MYVSSEASKFEIDLTWEQSSVRLANVKVDIRNGTGSAINSEFYHSVSVGTNEPSI